MSQPAPESGYSYEPGLKELGPGVFAWIGRDFGSNAGFVVGDEGVLVVDTLMTPSLAREFIQQIRRVTDKEVRLVANSHPHGDHIFGNQLFSPPAQIIGHANSRPYLRPKLDSYPSHFASSRQHLVEEFNQVNVMMPTITFQDSMTLFLDGRELQFLYFGPAHTTADMFIYLPKERVVFASDVVGNNRVPAFHDGYPKAYIATLAGLESLEYDSVMPGHGPMADKGQVSALKELLSLLLEEVLAYRQQGLDVARAAREIRPAKYRQWLQQDRLAGAVERLYLELDGRLPIPQ